MTDILAGKICIQIFKNVYKTENSLTMQFDEENERQRTKRTMKLKIKLKSEIEKSEKTELTTT